MKVSLSWLKEYIQVGMDVNDMAESLTMAGLEVDSVNDRYEYLNNVVVSRITDIWPHPNADNLKICKVDIGNSEISIVCGAPNAKQNMIIPCALPGACLPNGTTIKKGKIRGEDSFGMLCSGTELWLNSDGSGLFDLSLELENKTWAIGDPIAKALNLSDPVIEIDLTPNRADCLSIIGVAREVGAFQNRKTAYPEIDFQNIPMLDTSINAFSSVTIANSELCHRYAARLVFGIKIAESPFWLKDRLISIGLKPINNIVDITNFVMMETGQPLHAFDFDNLSENRIVVRAAQDKEHFITLDEKEHTLDSDMLMICDAKKPVAIAGIMGGLNSEIENSTTNVLIESAYFNPVSIRRTSKRLGINSDASHRFERGVDPEITIFALNRAAYLMATIAGGTLSPDLIDKYPKKTKEKEIVIDIKSANKRIGTDLTNFEIINLLNSIELNAQAIDQETIKVRSPSFRVDIDRKEDLTEEIARLWGYNNIKTTFPLIPAKSKIQSRQLFIKRYMHNIMAGLGFSEAINYSFISPLSCDRLKLKQNDYRRDTIAILNPISEDQSVLRTSLIPGLLEAACLNISKQVKNIKLFEIGKIFIAKDGQNKQPDEIEMLSGLWTGSRDTSSWLSKDINCDFYDIKGSIEELLRVLRITEYNFIPISSDLCDYTKPGYAAQIVVQDKVLGVIGEVHPKVIKSFDLKQTAYVFELNIHTMLPLIPETKTSQPIPKFPAIFRDTTIIVAKDILAGDILNNICSLDEELLEAIDLLDMYEGKPIPENKKSLSFRITYRSAKTTLTDDMVKNIHDRLTNILLQNFNAELP